jgi:pilus assembly protein CpaC
MEVLPIQGPEAEIAIVAGESRILQTRKPLTQIVISNPTIADVELLANRPEGRVLNISGKSYGNASLTLWDEDNRPISFLVRVTMDTKELENRINQAFPGCQVKVRQVGTQVILDGQATDSKSMFDITQLVSVAIRTSP